MSASLWIAIGLYAFAQVGIPLFGWAYWTPRDRATRLRWTTFAAFVVMSFSLGVVLLGALDWVVVPYWLKVVLGLAIVYSYLVGLFAFLWAVCPPPASRQELNRAYGAFALIGGLALWRVLSAYFELGLPLWAVLAIYAAHAVVGWRLWRSYKSKAAALSDEALQAVPV